MAFLEIESVRKSYGPLQVVQNFDLSIKGG
jgi:ABC-type sugar transport system ATPase subunit